MSDQIEYTYEGEQVWYDRRLNEWRWRGSSRGFATPEKAEASIDRANGLGKNDAPKFVRRPAFIWDHNFRSIRQIAVEVTSQDYNEFWVSTVEGKERSKKDARELFACTPENDAKFAEYCKLNDEVKALEKKRDAVRESAQRFADWLVEVAGGIPDEVIERAAKAK